MSAPPQHLMRNMLHIRARRFIWISLAASVTSTVAFYFSYVHPRHLKYEEHFKNYDAYKRMQEICAYDRKYLHTCPSELAKMAEEKGREVAPLSE